MLIEKKSETLLQCGEYQVGVLLQEVTTANS